MLEPAEIDFYTACLFCETRSHADISSNALILIPISNVVSSNNILFQMDATSVANLRSYDSKPIVLLHPPLLLLPRGGGSEKQVANAGYNALLVQSIISKQQLWQQQ